MYRAFSSMADEASAIPKFMTGSPPQGGLGRTASGLSMLMQNTSKILQTVASNVDRDVIEPVLSDLFDMVMLTDDTGLLTGEEKIRVLGVAVAQQRETQRARQLEFLQMTANPIDMGIIGPKGRRSSAQRRYRDRTARREHRSIGRRDGAERKSAGGYAGANADGRATGESSRRTSPASPSGRITPRHATGWSATRPTRRGSSRRTAASRI